jgi:glycosyltransferase involved in cell wall biosynthesis
MHIGLNAIGFVPGKFGGMETYLRNLVCYLQELDPNNNYTLFCDQKYAREFPVTSEQLQIRYINYSQPSFKWFVRGVVREVFDIDVLRLEMPSLGVDLLHHPFTFLSPVGSGIPSVLTFWDMQHEFLPEFFSRKELLDRKRLYQASTEEADRVIVSSQFTAQCLVEKYGTAIDKISVIYTGYGPQFRALDDQDGFERIRKKYSLDRPFLYYPAATWPHKNHYNLMLALKILIDEYGFEGDLLLTGIAKQPQDQILADIHQLGLISRIKVLGCIASDELPYLYNLARLLVFPSLFEGFGIPLVEAMACGCPVVCSNTTCLPEVLGDAGELIDPHSPEEIAEKIWMVWNDDAKRETMRLRGFERAKLFTWERTARETIQVYSQVRIPTEC